MRGVYFITPWSHLRHLRLNRARSTLLEVIVVYRLLLYSSGADISACMQPTAAQSHAKSAAAAAAAAVEAASSAQCTVWHNIAQMKLFLQVGRNCCWFGSTWQLLLVQPSQKGLKGKRCQDGEECTNCCSRPHSCGIHLYNGYGWVMRTVGTYTHCMLLVCQPAAAEGANHHRCHCASYQHPGCAASRHYRVLAMQSPHLDLGLLLLWW